MDTGVCTAFAALTWELYAHISDANQQSAVACQYRPTQCLPNLSDLCDQPAQEEVDPMGHTGLSPHHSAGSYPAAWRWLWNRNGTDEWVVELNHSQAHAFNSCRNANHNIPGDYCSSLHFSSLPYPPCVPCHPVATPSCRIAPLGCLDSCHILKIYRCYKKKIEESEKPSSCQESNPGHLG